MLKLLIIYRVFTDTNVKRLWEVRIKRFITQSRGGGGLDKKGNTHPSVGITLV